MKTLKDILYGVSVAEITGDPSVAITSVQFDSRRVRDHTLFVAIRGTVTDGHRYISPAICNGAIAVLCEEMPPERDAAVTYVVVANTAQALGVAASNYYDNPSSKVKLIGITGTNGKTTTATLSYRLFRALGYACGLISTIQIRIADKRLDTDRTTPDAVGLNRVLKQMVDAGVAYVFMEVSSHAIAQHRIAGLHFDGAVFTNLTHEHLDYHQTFASYRDAKKAFFDRLPIRSFALFNADDKNGSVMVQNTRAKVYTYALRRAADFKARVLENHFSGMLLSINGTDLFSPLVGAFNAYNLLAVYGIATLLDRDDAAILRAMSLLRGVKGRFQYAQSDTGIHLLIDYAHTPDALSKVLKTIDDLRTRNENLITVLGCGGNRDKSKRPEMARIAANLSDQVVLTSDNPRCEDLSVILRDMQAGITPDLASKVLTVADRKKAIEMACEMAAAADIVFLAGKGHQHYEEVQGVRYPFDEFAILIESLQKLKK